MKRRSLLKIVAIVPLCGTSFAQQQVVSAFQAGLLTDGKLLHSVRGLFVGDKVYLEISDLAKVMNWSTTIQVGAHTCSFNNKIVKDIYGNGPWQYVSVSEVAEVMNLQLTMWDKGLTVRLAPKAAPTETLKLQVQVERHEKVYSNNRGSTWKLTTVISNAGVGIAQLKASDFTLLDDTNYLAPCEERYEIQLEPGQKESVVLTFTLSVKGHPRRLDVKIVDKIMASAKL